MWLTALSKVGWWQTKVLCFVKHPQVHVTISAAPTPVLLQDKVLGKHYWRPYGDEDVTHHWRKKHSSVPSSSSGLTTTAVSAALWNCADSNSVSEGPWQPRVVNCVQQGVCSNDDCSLYDVSHAMCSYSPYIKHALASKLCEHWLFMTDTWGPFVHARQHLQT